MKRGFRQDGSIGKLTCFARCCHKGNNPGQLWFEVESLLVIAKSVQQHGIVRDCHRDNRDFTHSLL